MPRLSKCPPNLKPENEMRASPQDECTKANQQANTWCVVSVLWSDRNIFPIHRHRRLGREVSVPLIINDLDWTVHGFGHCRACSAFILSIPACFLRIEP